MTVLRAITLDGTGPNGWGDVRAIQKNPIAVPDVKATFTPAERPTGIPGYHDFVADPLGQRGVVFRSSLDAYDGIDSYGNRSEIYCTEEPVRVGTPITRLYEYSVMIPDEYEFRAADRYFVIQQIHDEPDGGDGVRWPPMIMYAGKGEFLVMLPKIDPPTDGDASSRVAGYYPMQRNRWYDVRVAVRLSIAAVAGFIEVTIDGNRIVREWFHGTSYDDAEGPQFKLGLYNIFKHTTDVAPSGKIARAYFSRCTHHSEPFAFPVSRLRGLSAF